jgi:hypothetical protein
MFTDPSFVVAAPPVLIVVTRSDRADARKPAAVKGILEAEL